MEELQQQYLEKQADYQALRDKSDTAILQTRMHLDRADRDYQHAMCREEEKKEQIMGKLFSCVGMTFDKIISETLREEFDKEKMEMEEKFRERLGHVKEEFSSELATQSQELKDEHKKELGEFLLLELESSGGYYMPLRCNVVGRRMSLNIFITEFEANFGEA